RALTAPTGGTFRTGDFLAERYRVVRYIARGGMGEVYEAQDVLLHTRVALKTLVITALDDVKAAARLKTEVILARQVTHPNVCRILEYGVCRGSVPHGSSIP